MTGKALDRDRASGLMHDRGLDALVFCEPEAIRYVLGAWAGPASLFRRAGSHFVVIPKDSGLPVCAVVTDFDAGRLRSVAPDIEIRTHPSWIETVVVDRNGADMPLERRVEAAILESGRSTDFARPRNLRTQAIDP